MTVTRIDYSHDGASDEPKNVKIRVRLAGREVVFNTSELSDGHGRVKVGYAYASTIASVQGLTCDRAVVLVDSNMDNASLYVSASRARAETILIVDVATTDRRITSERNGPGIQGSIEISREERMAWLTERFSRVTVKRTTLDPIFEAERWQATSNARIREGGHRRMRSNMRENSIG